MLDASLQVIISNENEAARFDIENNSSQTSKCEAGK
jgi:hypothetical protein